MAISSTAAWEVRTTGSDTNGGLFVPGGPGTDYTQQNAAQLSLTDVVTNGTTLVTSVTGGFTAAMIGNGINIAGTIYQIGAWTNTNSITIDRNAGAASGQTGKVGGAMATPGGASAQAVASNKIWIKAGTYTLTTVAADSGGKVNAAGGTAAAPFVIEGYQTTRGDKGTKPVINDGGLGGGGILILQFAAYTIVDNVEMVSTVSGNVSFAMIAAHGICVRCKSSGAGLGFYVQSTGTNCAILFCDGASSASLPYDIEAATLVIGSIAHGGAIGGFTVSAPGCTFVFCIAYSNTGAGFDGGSANGVAFFCCTAYNNTGSGFAVSSTGASAGSCAINCLSTDNGNYGFYSASASGIFSLMYCATYNNTSGATNGLANTFGMVVLSATPYVSAGTNFGLNSTAGGGAACRAAGLPSAFPGLASTISYPDIGAVQHQDSPAVNVQAIGPIVASMQSSL